MQSSEPQFKVSQNMEAYMNEHACSMQHSHNNESMPYTSTFRSMQHKHFPLIHKHTPAIPKREAYLLAQF
jgi:hypothetical protein